MEKDVKVIDLFCLAKVFYACKWFILSVTILGAVLGYGYAYRTSANVFQADFEIMLPLYCNRDADATVANLATRKEIIMEGAADDINVEVQSTAPRIICVSVSGKTEQAVSEFAVAYEQALVKYLNPLVNQIVMFDVQKASLQTQKPLTKEESKDLSTLENVVVLKHASVQSEGSEDCKNKAVLGAFAGLLLALASVFVKHAKEIVKDE